MNFPVTSNIYKNIPGKGSGLYYDPIYGYVPLPGYIREAIDLDVFQRLRGIKQLSTVFLIFPGALHTRFDHCIGVNYLASIMFNKFRELLDLPKPENPRIDPILEASMKLSSLFHDIGHGPFCHTFEMFCKRNEKFNVWTHEKFAKKLITGKDESNKIIRNPAFQQIPNYLKKLKSQFSKKYRNAENLSLLNPENIYNISAGYPPNLGKEALNNKYYFLKDIIASCYGLDRLDYLKRDAYFSGVNTGNIDIGEIINNLLLLKHNKKFRLFLKLKSVTALETLLQARNLVYRRLYHNSVHRSAQELIIRGLTELQSEPEDLCLLTDNELLSLFSEQPDGSFLSEINKRIKFRALFQNLKICDHLFIRDFKGDLETYTKLPHEWLKLKGKEEAIAEKAKMDKKKVFYDIIATPAVKSKDFEDLVFFDSINNKPVSLFELSKHLADLYEGEYYPGFSKEDQFNEYVSEIYVSFPLEEIIGEVLRIKDLSGNAQKKAINKLYIKKLEPLTTGFFNDIVMVGRRRKDFFKKNKKEFSLIKKRFIDYLNNLVSLYRAPYLI